MTLYMNNEKSANKAKINEMHRLQAVNEHFELVFNAVI
jgi:hypothetical protein